MKDRGIGEPSAAWRAERQLKVGVAFRMSFFGDYQARTDTQKMKNMRDQADWLLSNIIPAHVVEELKVHPALR